MSIIGPNIVEKLLKNFQNRSSQMSGKCYFKFGFCKQSHFVHHLKRTYKKCAKYSFISWDSQKSQKRNFQVGFVNTVSHNKATLLIFQAEVTESVVDILLYPESTMGLHDWAQRKLFKIKVLIWLENAIFRLVFANTVFHSNVATLLRRLCGKIVKHYSVSRV